jgi:hypothetical protein
LVRNDRLTRGGGVAIAINKRLRYKIIKIKSTRDYELLIVEVFNNLERVTILNAYTHPKSKTNFNFIKQAKELSNNKFIAVGDFNATHQSWYCNKNNKRGVNLEKVLFENKMIVANSNSGTCKKGEQNVIDLVCVAESSIQKIENISVDKDFTVSDHWPVIFEYKFSQDLVKYTKTNWNGFVNDLSNKFAAFSNISIDSAERIEECSTLVPNMVINSLKRNTKSIEKKPGSFKLPSDVQKMIKAKKKLQREFSYSHSSLIKTEINRLNNKIKKRTKKLNEGNWNELCSFLAESNPSETVFWKTVKGIESGNTSADFDPLPTTKNPIEKLKKFSEFYENTFQNNNPAKKKNLTRLFGYKDNSDPKFSQPITVAEIQSALSQTKATISTGLDQISNKILKMFPITALEYLSKIYNSSLNSLYIPTCWKVAKIKVLKKKDNNLDDPSSYRPISLLNTLSRLLEKIINIRLMSWAESTKAIHNNQSGFRKYRSTQDNIFRIIESCKKGLQKNEKAGIVLFDIEKAFDKAPHRGILEALHKLRCPNLLGLWLSVFLKERKFVVELNDKLSCEKNIKAGVPQGSPLSPLLFSLFINGIGKILDSFDINFGLFADDLTIWSIHKNLNTIQLHLQKAANAISNFFTKIGLKINASKCQYSIFEKSKASTRLNLTLTVNTNQIGYDPNPKILGIYFDPNLNFKFHFTDLKKQINSKINLLRILSYKSNAVASNKLLTIYKSLILSKIQYSMLPFSVTSKKIKSELQTLQNKCLKIILELPQTTSTELIHSHLRISSIYKRITNLTCDYLAKSKQNNQTIRTIIENHNNIPRPRSKKHRSILDRFNVNTLTPILTTNIFY